MGSQKTSDGATFAEFLLGKDGKPSRFSLFLAGLERGIKGPFVFGEEKSWVDFLISALHAWSLATILNTAQAKSGRDFFKDTPKLKALTEAIVGLPSASTITLPLVRPNFVKAEDDAVFSELKAE